MPYFWYPVIRKVFKMPYSLRPIGRKESSTFGVFHNVFSRSDCNAIIDLAKVIPPEEAITASTKEKRVSDIRWIHWQQGVNSIFEKIAQLVLEANQKTWNFHLSSIWEPLQLTYYTADKGGHYDWHMDYADVPVNENRKLSLTIVLNGDFEGGELEFWDTPKCELEIGSMVVFPSYLLHRVKPITNGERWSLVSWISGPSYV